MTPAITLYLVWCLIWSAVITVWLARAEGRSTAREVGSASFLPLRGRWLRYLLLIPVWILLIGVLSLPLYTPHVRW